MSSFPKTGRLAIVLAAIVASPLSAMFASTLTTAGSATARPLVPQKIDEKQLVTLVGNTHPATHVASFDRGAVADDFPLNHMLLQLKRSPEQEAALAKLMDALHTPGSPSYHQWLTEPEFDRAFGVAQSDVARVTEWLESHGFTVSGVTPDGMVIDFSGTAANVREAFHTDIHNLQLKNGEKHFANISDPKIPAALAGVVVGPTALHNFMPHADNVKRSAVELAKHQAHHGVKGPKGDYTYDDGGEIYAFVPGDAQTIYNVTPLLTGGYTGKGSSIGLIEDSDAYNTTNGVAPDWTAFMSAFGLTSYGGKQSTANPAGSVTCTDPGDTNDGTDEEVELDIEYASATAPGANVIVESCADTSTAFGGLVAVQNLVAASTISVPVLSISYGYCETSNGAANNAAYATAYQHGAARGISIFVSAGDESSTSCDADATYAFAGTTVSGFASTPYNVAVGGTDFSDTYNNVNSTYWSSTNSSTYESALSYIPEIPWNSSCGSELISNYIGYSTTYGSAGLCNSEDAQEDALLTTASGSGGPSNCYSGAASIIDEVYGTGEAVASGTCAGQPKPSWQVVYGNPADKVRDIPDVSLFASNGVWGHYIVLCYSNTAESGSACTGAPSGWAGVGGTSASSPMMAGIQTLINQYTGIANGNPNYLYYLIAANEYGTTGSTACNSSNGTSGTSGCSFYDITLGDNNVPCGPFSNNIAYNCYDTTSELYGVGSVTDTAYNKTYGTNKGWDFPTGIGSVNAYNLAVAFKKANPVATTSKLTVTPAPAASGQALSFKATVTAASGTPTGTVNIAYSTFIFGTCTLSGGTCTIPLDDSIPAGTYPVSITYSGVTGLSSYATSSATVNVTIAKATTTTTLAVTPNPDTPPAALTLTATVKRPSGYVGTPTGTVSFYYSTLLLGTSTLNSSGVATFTQATTGLPAGTYSLTAKYNGDTGDNTSSGTGSVTLK